MYSFESFKMISRSFRHLQQNQSALLSNFRMSTTLMGLNHRVGNIATELRKLNQTLIATNAATNARLDKLEQTLMATNARLDKLDQTLVKTNNILDKLNRKFESYTGNQAAANEVEVVECVASHLGNEGKTITNVCMPFFVVKKKRIVCEVDGVIVMPDEIAVIEAKSSVRDDAIVQLAVACSAVGEQFVDLPVIGYLGGLNFPQETRERALGLGYNIVVLSGDRFRVVKSAVERVPESDLTEPMEPKALHG